MSAEVFFVYVGLPLIVGAMGLAAFTLFIWDDNRSRRRAEAEAERAKG